MVLLQVKLWFDHIWCKPPLSHASAEGGPFPGSNRFHQDGFFQFSRPSVTCWIALDACGVTEQNGAFHYVPLTAAGGYGEFGFDIMGRGNGEGLSAGHLLEEQVVPTPETECASQDPPVYTIFETYMLEQVTLQRGDAVFHDRWTIHGTAPNESREKRRGWALHFADARSKWGDHGIALRDGVPNIVRLPGILTQLDVIYRDVS